MYAYPSSLPTEEIQLLLGKITGQNKADMPTLIQAGWVVQGYAQSQILPGQQVASTHGRFAGNHRELLATHFQSALAAGPVDWVHVLRIVVGLVQTWLSGIDVPPAPAARK